MKFYVLLAAIAVVSSSCGVFKKKKSRNVKVTKYFVHGDPKETINGATLNSESIFSVSNMDEFKDYNFSGAAAFISREKPAEKTEDIREGNEAQTGEDASEVTNHKFERGQEYAYQYRDRLASESQDIVLNFQEDKGTLNLVNISGLDVTPVHFSRNQERGVFSVLVSGDNEEWGEFLLVAYFTKNHQAKVKKDVDSEYNYLLGKGVRAAWEKDINISICGTHSDEDKSQLRDQMLKWQTADQQLHGHKLIVNELADFPPFSDVNSQCIRVLDNFKFENTEDAVVMGVAIPVINKRTRSIEDSDIFIFRTALNRLKEARGRDFSGRTITHEFGHFLGLDHEFDGPESIMDYKDVFEITEHDRKSIEALYTERKER